MSDIFDFISQSFLYVGIAVAVVLLILKKLKQTIYLVIFGFIIYLIFNWNLIHKWFDMLVNAVK